MDIRQGGALAVAVPAVLLVASVATWAVCRWWYGKQLAAALLRLQKGDKARLFSQEQTLQARRQIEQLKSELAAYQQTAAQSQAERRRVAQVEQVEHAAYAAAERAPVIDDDAGMMPLVSAHGFADTQILPD